MQGRILASVVGALAHTAKGRLRTRRLNPAGFSLAFAARGAMLTGEPFNPTFFRTDGITSEPN
jgi:hypothetical protein